MSPEHVEDPYPTEAEKCALQVRNTTFIAATTSRLPAVSNASLARCCPPIPRCFARREQRATGLTRRQLANWFTYNRTRYVSVLAAGVRGVCGSFARR